MTAEKRAQVIAISGVFSKKCSEGSGTFTVDPNSKLSLGASEVLNYSQLPEGAKFVELEMQ